MPKDIDNVSEALLSHIAEMIQLEHGIKIDGSNYLMAKKSNMVASLFDTRVIISFISGIGFGNEKGTLELKIFFISRENQAYPIFVDSSGRIVGCGKSLQERIDDGSFIGEKADFVPDNRCLLPKFHFY